MKARRHASAAGAHSVVNAMFPDAPVRKHQATVQFDLERFDHANYKEAFRQVMRLVHAGQPERMIIVTGPTGAGKSTLAKSVYEALRDEADASGCDASTIPSALVRSVTNSAPFNWKDLYIRLLEELYEPMADRQLLLPEIREMLLLNGGKMRGESYEIYGLRRRLEKAVRRRRTSVIIIDEAHHILIGGRRDRLDLQFETIKSLAQMTGAIIVLVGTYELLQIRDLSSQLVRRSEIVHLGRYDSNETKDATGFANFIQQAMKKVPLTFEASLQGIDAVDFFYRYSIGTPGIARDLMACALDEALDMELPAITPELLKRHTKAPEALETLLRAAIDGEMRMNRSSEERIVQLLAMPKRDAAAALGLCAANDPVVTETPPQAPDANQNQAPAGPKARSTGNAAPGTRRPQRDPVGLASAASARAARHAGPTSGPTS